MTPSPDALASRTHLRDRLLAVIGALALMMTLVVPFAQQASAEDGATAQQDPQDVTVDRFDGDNRADTAGMIADEDHDGTAETVLLARWDDFPDSLAANYLAGQIGVPILISHTTHITSNTVQWLEDLDTENVVILGGDAAISENAEAQLVAAGYDVSRIDGSDRFETAALLATGDDEDDDFDRTYGTFEGEPAAIVAAGRNFPDALVSGPLAADQAFPLLLTEQGSLPTFTADALGDLDIGHVLIPGGTAAVSQAVEDEINDMGIETTRFSGARRTETATMIADFLVEEFGFTVEHVNMGRSDPPDGFADVLALGPHAAGERNPIVLNWDPNRLDVSDVEGDTRRHTYDWLTDNACTIVSMHIGGGTAAVSQAVEDLAVEAAEDCPPPVVDDLTLDPQEATNEVGENHEVTATVTDTDGDAFAGAQVRFEVTGTVETTDTDVTDVDGNAFFDYDGTEAGADTITACTNEDGTLPDDCDDADVVFDTATKTWVDAPPEAEEGLYSGEFVNLNEANNFFDADVVEIDDQDTVLLPDGGTQAGAQQEESEVLRFHYDGNEDSFYLVIAEQEEPRELSESEFECVVRTTLDEDADHTVEIDYDPNGPSDFAVSTEADVEHCIDPAPALLTLDQDEDTNPVEASHTVTATVTEEDTSAAEGAEVLFEVYRDGADDPETTGTSTVEEAGTATFTYSGPAEEATDEILACTNPDGTAPDTCDDHAPEELVDSVTKEWQEREVSTVTIEPEDATNLVGTEHTVTVTALDQFDDPVEGAEFRFEVWRAGLEVNPVEIDDDTTDDQGLATFTYTGPDEPAEDEILACTNDDGSEPSSCIVLFADHIAEADKSWVEIQNISLDPEDDANLVGTNHEVTATVDPAVSDAQVLFEVTGTHEVTGTDVTDVDGNAFFDYDGTQSGEDTIVACTNEDGSLPTSCDEAEVVSEEATKQWGEGVVTNERTGETYTSLQAAIDAAQENDTLTATGTFEESIDIHTAVTLTSNPDATVTYTPESVISTPTVLISTTGVTFSDFTVERHAAGDRTDGTEPFAQGVLVATSGAAVDDRIELSGVVVTGSGFEDDFNSGIMIRSDGGDLLSGVDVLGNTVEGAVFASGIAVSESDGGLGTDGDVADVLIDGNVAEGYVTGVIVGHPDIPGDEPEVTVTNNDIAAFGDEVAGLALSHAMDAPVTGNTFGGDSDYTCVFEDDQLYVEALETANDYPADAEVYEADAAVWCIGVPAGNNS